jgi:UDP-N-acetyl-D-mannosaminuronate dehydrogenase
MELIEKVTSKKAHIGIIGLGYVGLPLVIEFCKAGFRVTGFDIDPEKVKFLSCVFTGAGRPATIHIRRHEHGNTIICWEVFT